MTWLWLSQAAVSDPALRSGSNGPLMVHVSQFTYLQHEISEDDLERYMSTDG